MFYLFIYYIDCDLDSVCIETLCYCLQTSYNFKTIYKFTLKNNPLNDNDLQLILKSISNSFMTRLNYLALGDSKRDDWKILLDHIKNNNLQNLEVLDLNSIYIILYYLICLL